MLKKKLLIPAVMFYSAFSSAADIEVATVKRLMIDRNLGVNVFVELDMHQSTPESCHTNTSWQYVLDISDDIGKAMYSSLLSLYATGNPAKFRGTSSCTLYSTIENLRRVEAK